MEVSVIQFSHPVRAIVSITNINYGILHPGERNLCTIYPRHAVGIEGSNRVCVPQWSACRLGHHNSVLGVDDSASEFLISGRVFCGKVFDCLGPLQMGRLGLPNLLVSKP